MKHHCALCGRATVPAAFIGAEPIGPTCARRAGLLKPMRGGRVRLARDPAPPPAPVQLDLLAAM